MIHWLCIFEDIKPLCHVIVVFYPEDAWGSGPKGVQPSTEDISMQMCSYLGYRCFHGPSFEYYRCHSSTG